MRSGLPEFSTQFAKGVKYFLAGSKYGDLDLVCLELAAFPVSVLPDNQQITATAI
jgi:hypothetical protein